MTTTKFTALGLTLLSLSGLLATGCSDSKGNGSTQPTGGAVLVSTQYGRLVDIYAYRRIESTRDDRRDTANRQPVLIARDVVVRPDIESTPLFDSSGNARLDADYRFLPFDVDVGHEELLILWDDQIPPEKAQFEAAMASATTGLPTVPGSFRTQNTAKRPIPVIPRNAAICLDFDRDLGVSAAFFSANPNAIQVLEFITPANGKLSFRPVPVRILSKGNRIVLDTSLIGGEAEGGRNTAGLPSSLDNRTANLRIALPTVGPVSKVLEFSEDRVAELNGVDSNGNAAVIRDFRSGNLADGTVGALADVEAPMVVAHLKMGITSIDFNNRIVTINKRNHDAAIRGRIPYVDGALDAATGLAIGPRALPTNQPLRSGDVLMQVVTTNTGEQVRIRAEVVMNLEVGNIVGDPNFVGLGMYRTGRDPNEPPDGGQDTFARLKVANLSATDSAGNPVTFKSNSFPEGEDCEVKVHYYQNVAYRVEFAGALSIVSDASRINTFLNVDPKPPILGPNRQVNFGRNVDPNAAIALRFSEPMNLEAIDPFENFMLTNQFIGRDDLIAMLGDHKALGLSLLAASLLDSSGDGTLLQLRTPLGHNHVQGTEETYWCHMVLGADGPLDMAGNPVDLFDRSKDPVESFSVSYSLNANAEDNSVGHTVRRFAAQDEDGTPPGSQDAFGQFQLLNGELRALPTARFSQVADGTTLQAITRFDNGECDTADQTSMPPTPAGITPPAPATLSLLYMCVSEANGISEPHNPRGARLQMTYREDDFGLSYRDAARLMLDVEQMHWAPFNDMAVPFDVFDRYTLRMAHSDWRPDRTNISTGGACAADCFSGRSGLRAVFDQNVLEGTTYETIVKDQTYEINPNDAFRTVTNTKMVPYPKFQKTYTWRDPRLIKWNAASQTATGFGGAHEPNASSLTQRDTTASISSPYVPDAPLNVAPDFLFAALHQNGDFVFDYGDFLGFRARDHSPIALPLLMDFSIYPDGAANGGAASGANQFHISHMGPCHGPAGYYGLGTFCTGVPFPESRAWVSGGKDLITGDDVLVDPDVESSARASVIKDTLINPVPPNLTTVPGQDSHVPWAQADFLRRVSMVTFGFWDTIKPNQHDFLNTANPYETDWKGRNTPAGIPDLSGKGNGVVDLVSMMDPPLSAQPIGTRVVLEFRGVSDFDNKEVIFNQPADQGKNSVPGTGPLASQLIVRERGNILNPYYACEAFRYARATELLAGYHPHHSAGFDSSARVNAVGLTPYVTEDRLDTIRQPNQLLPRYLNYRIIMENNVQSDPPLSPSLRSLAIAYRVGDGQ